MPQANTLGRRGFNLIGGGDACNFQGKPLRLCILCILAPSLFSFIASINLSSREDHETLSHIGVYYGIYVYFSLCYGNTQELR